ncbi:hypothetical protein BsWGS_16212 [Bradybaena similaris]
MLENVSKLLALHTVSLVVPNAKCSPRNYLYLETQSSGLYYVSVFMCGRKCFMYSSSGVLAETDISDPCCDPLESQAGALAGKESYFMLARMTCLHFTIQKCYIYLVHVRTF